MKLESLSKLVPNFPRRSVLDEMTNEEKEIQEIMWKIDQMGASEKLTECIVHLSKAKDALSDHLENL